MQNPTMIGNKVRVDRKVPKRKAVTSGQPVIPALEQAIRILEESFLEMEKTMVLADLVDSLETEVNIIGSRPEVRCSYLNDLKKYIGEILGYVLLVVGGKTGGCDAPDYVLFLDRGYGNASIQAPVHEDEKQYLFRVKPWLKALLRSKEPCQYYDAIARYGEEFWLIQAKWPSKSKQFASCSGHWQNVVCKKKACGVNLCCLQVSGSMSETDKEDLLISQDSITEGALFRVSWYDKSDINTCFSDSEALMKAIRLVSSIKDLVHEVQVSPVIQIKEAFVPRSNAISVVKKVQEGLQTLHGNFLAFGSNQATGSGKSNCTIELIQDPVIRSITQLKLHVIFVNSLQLLDQMYRDIMQFGFVDNTVKPITSFISCLRKVDSGQNAEENELAGQGAKKISKAEDFNKLMVRCREQSDELNVLLCTYHSSSILFEYWVEWCLSQGYKIRSPEEDFGVVCFDEAHNIMGSKVSPKKMAHLIQGHVSAAFTATGMILSSGDEASTDGLQESIDGPSLEECSTDDESIVSAISDEDSLSDIDQEESETFTLQLQGREFEVFSSSKMAHRGIESWSHLQSRSSIPDSTDPLPSLRPRELDVIAALFVGEAITCKGSRQSPAIFSVSDGCPEFSNKESLYQFCREYSIRYDVQVQLWRIRMLKGTDIWVTESQSQTTEGKQQYQFIIRPEMFGKGSSTAHIGYFTNSKNKFCVSRVLTGNVQTRTTYVHGAHMEFMTDSGFQSGFILPRQRILWNQVNQMTECSDTVMLQKFLEPTTGLQMWGKGIFPLLDVTSVSLACEKKWTVPPDTYFFDIFWDGDDDLNLNRWIESAFRRGFVATVFDTLGITSIYSNPSDDQLQGWMNALQHQGFLIGFSVHTYLKALWIMGIFLRDIQIEANGLECSNLVPKVRKYRRCSSKGSQHRVERHAVIKFASIMELKDVYCVLLALKQLFIAMFFQSDAQMRKLLQSFVIECQWSSCSESKEVRDLADNKISEARFCRSQFGILLVCRMSVEGKNMTAVDTVMQWNPDTEPRSAQQFGGRACRSVKDSTKTSYDYLLPLLSTIFLGHLEETNNTESDEGLALTIANHMARKDFGFICEMMTRNDNCGLSPTILPGVPSKDSNSKGQQRSGDKDRRKFRPLTLDLRMIDKIKTQEGKIAEARIQNKLSQRLLRFVTHLRAWKLDGCPNHSDIEVCNNTMIRVPRQKLRDPNDQKRYISNPHPAYRALKNCFDLARGRKYPTKGPQGKRLLEYAQSVLNEDEFLKAMDYPKDWFQMAQWTTEESVKRYRQILLEWHDNGCPCHSTRLVNGYRIKRPASAKSFAKKQKISILDEKAKAAKRVENAYNTLLKYARGNQFKTLSESEKESEVEIVRQLLNEKEFLDKTRYPTNWFTKNDSLETLIKAYRRELLLWHKSGCKGSGELMQRGHKIIYPKDPVFHDDNDEEILNPPSAYKILLDHGRGCTTRTQGDDKAEDLALVRQLLNDEEFLCRMKYPKNWFISTTRLDIEEKVKPLKDLLIEWFEKGCPDASRVSLSTGLQQPSIKSTEYYKAFNDLRKLGSKEGKLSKEEKTDLGRMLNDKEFLDLTKYPQDWFAKKYSLQSTVEAYMDQISDWFDRDCPNHTLVSTACGQQIKTPKQREEGDQEARNSDPAYTAFQISRNLARGNEQRTSGNSKGKVANRDLVRKILNSEHFLLSTGYPKDWFLNDPKQDSLEHIIDQATQKILDWHATGCKFSMTMRTPKEIEIQRPQKTSPNSSDSNPDDVAVWREAKQAFNYCLNLARGTTPRTQGNEKHMDLDLVGTLLNGDNFLSRTNYPKDWFGVKEKSMEATITVYRDRLKDWHERGRPNRGASVLGQNGQRFEKPAVQIPAPEAIGNKSGKPAQKKVRNPDPANDAYSRCTRLAQGKDKRTKVGQSGIQPEERKIRAANLKTVHRVLNDAAFLQIAEYPENWFLSSNGRIKDS